MLFGETKFANVMWKVILIHILIIIAVGFTMKGEITMNGIIYTQTQEMILTLIGLPIMITFPLWVIALVKEEKYKEERGKQKTTFSETPGGIKDETN